MTVAMPLMVARVLGVRRHYERRRTAAVGGRSGGCGGAGRAQQDAPRRRVARPGHRRGRLAGRARSRRTASARSTCRCAAATPASGRAGSTARGGKPLLEVHDDARAGRRGRARAGLAAAAQRVRLRRPSSFPSCSSRRSLPEQVAASARAPLKLRLLTEQGVVVADVPSCVAEAAASRTRARRAGLRLRRERRFDARRQLGAHAQPADTQARQLRLRRGGGARDPARVGGEARGSRSTCVRRRTATSATRCSPICVS